MNRKLLLFVVSTLPLFFMGLVFEAIQYQDLKKDVVAKERQQVEWVEKNKKMLTGVTVLSSPQRIEDLAKDDSGLKLFGADKSVKIHFTGSNATGVTQ